MDEITEEERLKVYKSDSYRLYIVSIVFVCISIVLILVWSGIFVLNLRYQQWRPVVPLGDLILDTRYQLTWWLIFPLAFNLLLPYALLSALAKKESLVRFDLHYVLSWILFFIDLLILIALILLSIFYYNSLWSVGDPLADPIACCRYSAELPSVCFSGCPPGIADSLSGASFGVQIAFAAVFLVFTGFNLGINRLMHTPSGLITTDAKTRIDEGTIMGLFFVFLSMALIVYWVAVPLFNTIHIHGYPLFGIPPSPGAFQSTRYTLPYWALFVLSLNLLCPYLFLMAMAIRNSYFAPWLYLWVTIIMCFATLGVIVYFALYWVIYCNYPFSKGSLCNDYTWCGAYFDQAPELCGNVTPLVPMGSLFANPEFVQHFIFGILFFILDITGLWLKERMKKYGVFF